MLRTGHLRLALLSALLVILGSTLLAQAPAVENE